MADVIRIEEMDASDEEKKLIIKALTDKAFRDQLQRQVGDEGAELSDDQLQAVSGGITMSLSAAKLRGVLSSVRTIESRILAGAEVLCGGGPCGIA
jgi:bacteriocin-like protein